MLTRQSIYLFPDMARLLGEHMLLLDWLVFLASNRFAHWQFINIHLINFNPFFYESLWNIFLFVSVWMGYHMITVSHFRRPRLHAADGLYALLCVTNKPVMLWMSGLAFIWNSWISREIGRPVCDQTELLRWIELVHSHFLFTAQWDDSLKDFSLIGTESNDL
jgi:hypothetical protein